VTAARAYNKVVVFLYGDRAITNLLPDSGDEDDSTDTFDIPFAIRQAKLEAQQQPTSTHPSIHPSTSFSTSSSAASSTGSGDSLTTHGGGNSSSSASMQQLAAGGPAMLQLHDPLLLLPPYGGLSSLLPLSCGPGALASSTLDSSLLPGHTFTAADLASTTTDVLHPSMGFLDITGASTACMQMQVPFPVGSAAFSVLQEPSSISMASTHGLLADTTQQLQLMDLSSSSLLHGPSSVSYSAPDAMLGAGFLQASTCLQASTGPPQMVQELHLTSMQHAATTLGSVLAAPLPTLLPTASSAVDAGLLLGSAAAQHAGNAPGVVMGFPVAAQSLCMPAQAPVAQQPGPLVRCAQSSPVVASNGMVVMFAPAPPA
jgi:hypothetical protein